MRPFPIARVRREFPALAQSHNGGPRVFVDTPAGTQLPRRVIDAMADAASNYGGFFENSRNAEAIHARAHAAMAGFANARSPDEIVVAQSMTALTLHVSRPLGRRWARGDEIIVTRMDHEGNRPRLTKPLAGHDATICTAGEPRPTPPIAGSPHPESVGDNRLPNATKPQACYIFLAPKAPTHVPVSKTPYVSSWFGP